ncbi:MAG: hypothetical protein RBS86_04910 [Candidatus Moranbacteria bacterium]|jgi:hypothetical protein|nr:hypothetical protein [Candidatus Moranbacteria bacterium]
MISSKEKGKDGVYYLMRDIISCFPYKDGNFLGAMNHHFIAKNAIRLILLDEIKKKKPEFRILAGALTIQNTFLHQLGRVAIYEMNEVIPALKFCLTYKKSKIVKRLSAEVVLRLFTVLYFEYIIMHGRREEGKEFIEKFKKCINRDDVIDAMNTNRVYPRFIFESNGIELGFGKEGKKRFHEILNKFYK